MTKFYVHRTNLAYVTEVTEIEAASESEAIEKVDDGYGDFVGVHIGDDSDYSNEVAEAFEAAPHNLPFPFYPAKAAA